jgi:hypothetical protein
LLDFVTLIICDENWKPQIPSFSNFLHPPYTSSFIGPATFLSTPPPELLNKIIRSLICVGCRYLMQVLVPEPSARSRGPVDPHFRSVCKRNVEKL